MTLKGQDLEFHFCFLVDIPESMSAHQFFYSWQWIFSSSAVWNLPRRTWIFLSSIYVSKINKKGYIGDKIDHSFNEASIQSIMHTQRQYSSLRSNLRSNLKSNQRSNQSSSLRSNLRLNQRSNLRLNLKSNLTSNQRSSVRSNQTSNLGRIRGQTWGQIRGEIWAESEVAF